MVIEADAPAKINLTLHVTGRRNDGYHLLNSLVVFAPDIADRITVARAGDLSLIVTGPRAAGVPADDGNIVLKAARLMRSLRGVSTGAAITLDKHLPHAAGIGGGSSDAAAAIRALADLWGVDPLTGDEALILGADLPVCLSAPVPMIMEGIGDILTPARVPEMWLLLVNPGIEVSTGAIFRSLTLAGSDLSHQRPHPAMADDNLGDFARWIQTQSNDLFDPADTLAPQIGQALDALRQTAPLAANMSGSGATLWGMYETKDKAQAAARSLAKDFPAYWLAVSPTGSNR